METRTGVAAGCSTSGRPACAGMPVHGGCQLGRRSQGTFLRGTPLRHIVQGSPCNAARDKRCADGHVVGRRGAMAATAMFGGLGKLFASDVGEKTRRQYQPRVDAINALEPSLKALSDEELRGRTAELQARYKRGETLDDLLVDAFAVCTGRPCRTGPLSSPGVLLAKRCLIHSL